MFWKKKKKPFAKLVMGLDLKRCVECEKYIRPCLVGDKPAVFHRWIDEDRALLKVNEFTHPRDVAKFVSVFRDEAVIPNACSVETIRATYALVEYADGSVGRVDPKLVQFTDK